MHLYSLIKVINIELRKNPINLKELEDDFAALNDMLSILGIKFDYPKLTPELKHIYEEYLKAKANKDFTTSDNLRQILINNHIL